MQVRSVPDIRDRERGHPGQDRSSTGRKAHALGQCACGVGEHHGAIGVEVLAGEGVQRGKSAQVLTVPVLRCTSPAPAPRAPAEAQTKVEFFLAPLAQVAHDLLVQLRVRWSRANGTAERDKRTR